ncbi:MAG: hypothetical protein HC845_01830 [Akkermansiaceae bacterium]|nr:hypothetical protein [Akkermansiaceae bacterium]
MPTRCMLHALRVTPWFLEPVLIAPWTFLFFVIGKNQRCAVAGNLQALFPHWGKWRASFGAWRVFWNFALTLVDAQRCETQTGDVDWIIDGIKNIDDLNDCQKGCVILTAHMGNYDLAAPFFAARFQRTLYTVRAPEREPETQKLREAEIRQKEILYPNFRTLYNQDGNLLGIELARLLGEGNIVAVQGDRVVFDVSPMDVEVEPGLIMRLPRGPLYLAQATGAPCFPLFILRDGWRRYQICALPQMRLPPRRRGQDDEAAKIWANTILHQIRRHWSQWYVFEPLVRRIDSGNGDFR